MAIERERAVFVPGRFVREVGGICPESGQRVGRKVDRNEFLKDWSFLLRMNTCVPAGFVSPRGWTEFAQVPLMKRLIRKSQTKLYYNRGEWTVDVNAAQDFPNAVTAIQTTIRENLPNVEIVLQFGSSPSEIYDLVVVLSCSRH